MKNISVDNGNSFATPEKAIEKVGFLEIVSWMDNKTREEVHTELAPCNDVQFLVRYLERAKENIIIG